MEQKARILFETHEETKIAFKMLCIQEGTTIKEKLNAFMERELKKKLTVAIKSKEA